MKIDKVVFSTSVEYSDFWNINSKIFKTKLGIEPVCLLFGDRNKTDVNEDYGKVIDMPIISDLPLLLQITWSKFYHTTTELDTTWLIGDIDMLPLQTRWFKENIASIPDEHYIHLNVGGNCAMQGLPADHWYTYGGILEGGCDLPAHYHAAKGSTFKTTLDLNTSFDEQVRWMVNTKRYGLGHLNKDFNGDRFYWCAEEHRTTELIRSNIKKKITKFQGFAYNTTNNGQRVDRGGFNNNTNDYSYDRNKLVTGQFVDVHCMRPFKKYQAQNENLVKLAGML